MKAILCPPTPNTAPVYTPSRHTPLKRRVLIAVMVVVLMALGITAGAAMYWGFARKEHKDNTELFPINTANAPKTIEYMYYLPEIPEGYALYKQFPGVESVMTTYINTSTHRTLNFHQYVKDGFSAHIDNEHTVLEEIEINGKYALYYGNNKYGEIILDNDDYILSVSGDFSREELTALLISAEIGDVQ